MPYERNDELPKSVRDSLPDAAQTIYRKTYNSTHENNPDYNEDRLAKVSWAAVKRSYRKTDGNWVRAIVHGDESSVEKYDLGTHTIRAIKTGTVATVYDGSKFTCTAEWLQAHAVDWVGGKLIANHNGRDSTVFGEIKNSVWEDPFVVMELSGMVPEAEQRMVGGENTGFSFDADVVAESPVELKGTNLSILFYPHKPACPVEEGCGLVAESQSSPDATGMVHEDIKNINGSELMAENKTYTDAEIASMKEASAEVATLTAEASTHESAVAALKAEIGERNTTISDLSDKVDKMVTAEAAAEATKTAVEDAITAEKARIDGVAAELDAINSMFPEGLDEDFKREVVAMVMDGRSHDALVHLGTKVEYKTLKASIPVATETKKVAEAEDKTVERMDSVGIPAMTFGEA